jgi:hypothetical protein
MCDGCWSEWLDDHEPDVVTSAVIEAVRALHALYEVHGAGGKLHVYVDDWNLPVPESMESWKEVCLKPFEPDAVELACWEAMRALTLGEQHTALAIQEFVYVPDDASRVDVLHARRGLPSPSRAGYGEES